MRLRRGLAWIAAGLLIGCGVMYVRRDGNQEAKGTRIEVGPGPEDFVLDRTRLLISSRDRRERDAEGAILRLDLGADRGVRMELKGRGDARFFPVGISLVETEGESRLYVINKPPDGPKSIEIFRVGAGDLQFVGAIKERLLTSPNDVLALPDRTVFVTNDGAGLISGVFRLRRGNLVRFSKSGAKQIGEKIAFANGLATDGKSLFVAHFGAKKIVVYDLESAKREDDPKPSYTIEVPGFPDNLSVEADGRTLDVAIHPSMGRTFLHLTSKRFHAPSAYARIEIPATPPPNGVLRVTKRVDVPDYDAASTALLIGDSVYLSQLCEPDILVLSAR